MIIKFDDELKCWKTPYDTYHFSDTSMNRVLEHMKNGAFAISAMTEGLPVGKTYDEFTESEKQLYKTAVERTRELRNDLRAAGFGYISALGGYKYDPDENRNEPVDAQEFSFIVPKPKDMDDKTFVETAVNLGKKYEQKSIMIGGIPEIANGQVRYLQPSNANAIEWEINPDMEFSNVHVYKEIDREKRPYYTAPKKMGGRNIVFDSMSKRNLSSIVGVRYVYGSADWRKANTFGEIVIPKED